MTTKNAKSILFYSIFSYQVLIFKYFNV